MCGLVASCVDNREAGIALPIEVSFISTHEILQIMLIAVLRDQKRGGNGGVSIVVDEFADKLWTDSIGIEELSHHFRLIRRQISSLLVKSPPHILEARHHFLTFLRVEVDTNAIFTCQQVRRPLDLRRGLGKLMSFQKGFHVFFGC